MWPFENQQFGAYFEHSFQKQTKHVEAKYRKENESIAQEIEAMSF